MIRMVVRVRGPVKRELRRLRQKTSDKGLAARCQIILLWGESEGWFEIAKGVGCSMSWVGRVIRRSGVIESVVRTRISVQSPVECVMTSMGLAPRPS